MNELPLNPLSDLTRFKQPKQKTGRRELRAERNAMGYTIHAHPASKDEAIKAGVLGEMVKTLPIKREQPKRGGLSKKEFKKLRRLARERAGE